LKKIVKDEKVHVFVSPYARTLMTADIMLAQLSKGQVKNIRIDPRLREQEFGNIQSDEAHKENERSRDLVGRFFFRFPTGESAADVFDRVSSMMDSLYRYVRKREGEIEEENIVIVSHGITMRCFLMRHFKWSPETFQTLFNPQNCEFWILERNENNKLVLAEATENSSYPQSSRRVHIIMKNGDVIDHTINDYLRLEPPRQARALELLAALKINRNDVKYVDFWLGRYNTDFMDLYNDVLLPPDQSAANGRSVVTPHVLSPSSSPSSSSSTQ
jgi:broad specificity phosphatase PhoE